MSRRFSVISYSYWLVLLLALSVACTRETGALPSVPTLTPFPPDLYIGLGDSAAPLGDLVSAAFEASPGERAPRFLIGNEETLLNDLERGDLEAAIVHYLPSNSQMWFTPIALDGVVITVHPDLGLEDLSSSHLLGILSGSFNNWSQLGGPDLDIDLLVRENGSGARSVLQERLLRNVRLTGLARIAPTDEFMKQEVLASPGAVGYTMMASAGSNSTSVDGYPATPETVAAQSYPLTTPLYFASRGEPQGQLREFLAWLESPDGQSVLSEKYGRVR